MKAGTSEAQRRRLGEGGLVVAMDARSQRLLRYEEKGTRGAAALDAHCWGERDAVEARSGRRGSAPCSACPASAHVPPAFPVWLLCRLVGCFSSSCLAVFSFAAALSSRHDGCMGCLMIWEQIVNHQGMMVAWAELVPNLMSFKRRCVPTWWIPASICASRMCWRCFPITGTTRCAVHLASARLTCL